MSERPHLLIVDDDREIRTLLGQYFETHGYRTTAVAEGRAMRRVLQQSHIDLIVLDLMLPGEDGLALCRDLRTRSQLPIIMLTARGEEMDRVNGLEAGVDDYVVKPFSTRELIARIRAVLRRAQADDGTGSIEIGGLRIDGPAHRVYAGDTQVEIGPTEYRLLHFFMSHAERAYSRAQLLDQVWGGSVYVEERTVDVHIRRLRKSLEPFGLDGLIQTVRGTGYRFSTQRP